MSSILAEQELQQTSAAAHVFDEIVHNGAVPETVDEAESSWTTVAVPRTAAPIESLQPGDVVVERALGEGRVAAIRIIGRDVEPHALYDDEGLIRRDTLVVRQNPPASAMPATKAQTSLQILSAAGTPLVNARWEVHQGREPYRGGTDANGWTGPIDRTGPPFDRAQPFRLHVEGCVCSIVGGAQLMVDDPSVEYGGQHLDWRKAGDSDLATRSRFWEDYGRARGIRGPMDVFHFLQHDHIMRRPVRLVGSQGAAIFEARPLSVRLGPLVRYTDATRALIWVELETPGLVRVTFGKAARQDELPAKGDQPAARQERFATSVRVGGRHFACVALGELLPDTVYQYTLMLAPQPPSGPLPMNPGDFSDAIFPRQPRHGDASTLAEDLRSAHFPDQQWLFFRTTPKTFEHLRFAHGSCRKWAGESEQPRDTGPDMLDALGRLWLGSKRWSEWPQFFLHTGDQIYADDVSLHMAGSILRHRVATVVPGPAPADTHDVAFGAWAGRFGFRYGPSVPPPPPSDLDQLHKLRPRVDDDFSTHDIDYAMKLAERARKQGEAQRARPAPLPVAGNLQVNNGLLWQIPEYPEQVPRADRRRGLIARQEYHVKGGPKGNLQIEYPSAGDTMGVHAADFAEYAALYGQAWSQPGARRVLAHVPSFMIFDDHEVTDDWNADKDWLAVIHARADTLRMWPHTMTDALCAYWVYQGWGNLSPEAAAGDDRVRILERHRASGRDALPELRRLVLSRAIETTVPPGKDAPAAPAPAKLDWHFAVPAGAAPFFVVDLRTDRQATGDGRMTTTRLNWIEKELRRTTSPVAFIVLPVPFLMPDPMLYAFRHMGFVAWLDRARSTLAFQRSSDLEHPAGNPVWIQIRDLVGRIQASSTALKTIVLLSGDIHLACNLDGQLPGSEKPPRLLQLISSGMRQGIDEDKQGQLKGAYNKWYLNMIARSQGVDTHRGLRITLGGLEGPDGKRRNFIFNTSVAVVDVTIVPFGTRKSHTRVPVIQQEHLVCTSKGDIVGYRFRHMTQGDGSAVMMLKDPGFEHPASPKDYPSTTGGDAGGIGVAREEETTSGVVFR